VLDKVEDSVKRIDDLRALSEKLADEKIKRMESDQKHLWELHKADARRIDEQAVLRASYSETIHRMEREHSDSLRKAESERLNAIRQVDREDVSKTAAQVLNSVQILATGTTTTAETLRNQRSQDQTEINKRVSAVELALSEGKGKQIATDPTMDRLVANMERLILAQSASAGAARVADPATAEMTAAVKLLVQQQANSTGRREGVSGLVTTAIAIGTLLMGLLGALGISFVMKAAG